MVLFKLLNHFKKGDQSGQSSILATAAKGMTSSVPTSPTPLVRRTSSGVTNLTTDRGKSTAPPDNSLVTPLFPWFPDIGDD